MPDTQVTLLLPLRIALGSEHVTSTTVPECTGNFAVVSIVLANSVLIPVQPELKITVLKVFH